MAHPVDPERLDLWLDGQLSEADRALVASHVAACAACRAESERLRETHHLLADERIEVRPGFAEAVMDALPSAAWEARGARAWAWPAAALAAFGLAAAALLGRSAAPLAGEASFAAAVAAIGELLVAAAFAGSGLLAASWRGVGWVAADLVAAEPATLVVAALAVAAANLYLYRLLRRPSAAALRRRDSAD